MSDLLASSQNCLRGATSKRNNEETRLEEPRPELPTLVLSASTAVVELPDQVRAFIRASKAPNTLRGYRADWRDFCAWCESNGHLPLPSAPEAVATYIAECAGRLKPDSIQRRLNAIAEAHKVAGLESPTHAGIVKNVVKGIRRTLGTAPVQKAPA